VYKKDTSASTFYFSFDSVKSFHWINCDYFYGSTSPLTDVSVIVPDTSFNPSNTQVFVIFPTINSATYIHNYTVATHTYDLFAGYHVPVGMTIDLAVVSKKGGVYYYYEKPV